MEKELLLKSVDYNYYYSYIPRREKKLFGPIYNETSFNRCLALSKVALYNTLIAGFYRCYWFEVGVILVIQILSVIEDFRSMGIGKYMLKNIFEECKDKGVKHIMVIILSDNPIIEYLCNEFGFRQKCCSDKKMWLEAVV